MQKEAHYAFCSSEGSLSELSIVIWSNTLAPDDRRFSATSKRRRRPPSRSRACRSHVFIFASTAWLVTPLSPILTESASIQPTLGILSQSINRKGSSSCPFIQVCCSLIVSLLTSLHTAPTTQNACLNFKAVSRTFSNHDFLQGPTTTPQKSATVKPLLQLQYKKQHATCK